MIRRSEVLGAGSAGVSPAPGGRAARARCPSAEVCLALVAVLSLADCGDSGVPARINVGDPLPGFSLPALDGSEVDSGSLAGKVSVLNFWATWCQPCLKEIPELKALAADDRLEVVGIALDEEGERAVRPFVQSHGMRYRILLGDQRTFQRLGGFAIPYTLVVGPDLRVINVYRGPATRADIERDLDQVPAAA